MPAVVRGGRRQSSGSSRGVASKKGGRPRGGAPKPASAIPGKMAAIGRIDVSPRTVMIALGASALLVIGVLATGARAERIGQSVSHGIDGVTAGMGLTLKRVHITGASAEAEPAIQQALGLIVEIKEHDRLAVWQDAGQIKVIDAQGQVIQGADARRYPTLPLVVGKGADLAAGEVLPLLAQRPRLMSRVDALVRVDERRWDLRLKDGSLIQLPAVEQEAALIRLDALDQRERLLDLGFARVDLRTPDEVAVRPAADA